jgi:formyl-CoA transferase
MTGPLDGLKVLDFGAAGVGPWAASLLGFLGANVLKVERPEGEVIRTQAPFQKGVSVAYSAWNMAKKSAEFDMKVPAGRAALEPLLREADVVTANLRPGVMERLGLGYHDVRTLNPAIVYASSPGWGVSGPMEGVPGGDSDFQAFSGFASLNGDEDGPPEMARHGYHFDLNASGMLAATILLGLLQRDRTKEGQNVGSSHLGSTLSLLTSRAAEFLILDQDPVPLGSASANTAPHEAYLCQDNRWLTVGVESDAQWAPFCRAISRADLLDDPRFQTNLSRVEHRKELSEELRGVFAARPSSWWLVQLNKQQVPAGTIYDFEALRNHQQVIENEQIVGFDVSHQGTIYIGGLPWQLSKTPAALYPPPVPGANTEEMVDNGFAAFGGGDAPEARFAPEADPNSPPLAGIRVLDLSQGLCGPYASLALADAGAEVIKVEPPEGDYARRFAPVTATGDGAAFGMLNRNKKSVVLDLATEAETGALRELISSADILIEDWGPGEAEKLGLDYESLSRTNPGLVICAISPFGEKGPMRDLKGSEVVVQGFADYFSSLGVIDGPPVRWGADVANLSAGTMAFLGILAALYHRNRHGEGQRVAVSQLGVLLSLRQAIWSTMGDIDAYEGAFRMAYYYPRLYGWATKDKPVYFRLHRASEVEYFQLLLALGLEEALGDERFANGGRDAVGGGKYAAEVLPIWEKAMRDKTSDEVIAIATAHNSVVIPVNTIREAIQHEQMAHLGAMKEMDHPVLGKLQVIGPPFKGPWAAPAPMPAPALGQHSAELLEAVPARA